MVDANRPPRPVTRCFCRVFGIPILAALLSVRIPAAEPETFGIRFLPDGTAAWAVVSPDSRHLVSVNPDPGNSTKAQWTKGKIISELDSIGHDRITRLCFFENPTAEKRAVAWAKSFGGSEPKPLRAITGSGPVGCRYENWVTQVGDKVLPLGLLAVSFDGRIPESGTPLIDAEGNIVALVLERSTGNTAYAIPAQAVHRVQHDITKHQTLVRGWMGLSLSTESAVPRITRIWPESPAAKAKLRQNDILVKAGAYPTERYPDAVNALFYAIPGEAMRIEVVRGGKRIGTTVTPTVQKPGD